MSNSYRFVTGLVSQVLLENHNKPFLFPLLLLCQTFPDPSYFDPVGLSHVYLYGHINLSQNKPRLDKASVVL